MISISYPSKSPLNPIMLHLNSSQVPSQPHPGLWMGVSPPSMSRLTSIQFLIVASLLHPHRVSPPPRSWYLHLISIHVASHLQVARCETCSSALSMFHPQMNLLIILYSSCTWFFSALHTDTQNHYAYIMCGSVKEVWQETWRRLLFDIVEWAWIAKGCINIQWCKGIIQKSVVLSTDVFNKYFGIGPITPC